MKANTFIWYETNTLKAKLPEWFHHNTISEVSWEQVQELFATGLNVMLKHTKDNDEDLTLICVAERHFGGYG